MLRQKKKKRNVYDVKQFFIKNRPEVQSSYSKVSCAGAAQ